MPKFRAGERGEKGLCAASANRDRFPPHPCSLPNRGGEGDMHRHRKQGVSFQSIIATTRKLPLSWPECQNLEGETAAAAAAAAAQVKRVLLLCRFPPPTETDFLRIHARARSSPKLSMHMPHRPNSERFCVVALSVKFHYIHGFCA